MYEKNEVGPLGKCHLILDPSLTSDRSIPRVKALSSHLPRFYEKKPSSPHGAEAATSGGCMASWVDVDVDPVLQLGKRFKKPLARLSRTLNMLKFFNVPLKMF
jgi:hypothetical protein